jgi:hypothetical protein
VQREQVSRRAGGRVRQDQSQDEANDTQESKDGHRLASQVCSVPRADEADGERLQFGRHKVMMADIRQTPAKASAGRTSPLLITCPSVSGSSLMLHCLLVSVVAQARMMAADVLMAEGLWFDQSGDLDFHFRAS